MKPENYKPLLVLSGEIKSPPFSERARRKAGFLLRMLQNGEVLSMPDSRYMRSIGPRCNELRVNDPESGLNWRIIYRIDYDCIVLVDIFAKQTSRTPYSIIDRCKERLSRYDQVAE